MSLPYLWNFHRGGYVDAFSYPLSYYTVSVYNIYGDLVSRTKLSLYPSNNDSEMISSVFGLDINCYKLILQFYIQKRPSESKASSLSYDKVFTGNSAIFNPSYYSSRSYSGKTLGRYLSSEKTYEYGTSSTTGDEYIYYYENGFVSVFDIKRVEFFKVRNSNINIDYQPFSGYQVFIKRDTRIPTNCCLLYKCQPTKYKKA